MKIFIDWKEIKSFDDFYDCFLPQVEAPEWHGRNMNAFRDSIIVGSINKIEPPYCVINTNTESFSGDAKEVFDAVSEVFLEANNEGRTIRLFNE